MTRRSVFRGVRRSALLCIPACGFIVFLGAFNAPAEEKKSIGDTIQERIQEVFNLGRGAVVKVQASDLHGLLEGTGFYADPTGTIYTLASTVGDATDITVTQGAKKLPARLLLKDPRTGIALIKVEANTPFLPIGDSSKVDVAAPVIAIGYPMGEAVCPSFGLVAGRDKEYLNRYFRTTHIRANLPIQNGQGGAPVLNMDGEVIGIVLAGVNGNASCYMLPINAAEKIRMDYVRFGELRPGWLGVSVEPDTTTNAPSSARVANLQPGAPATECGLQVGDIVLKVGDIPIRSPEDVFDASFFLTAGDETSITVLRNGEEISLPVRSTQNPAHRSLNEQQPMPVLNSMPPLDLDAP